MFRSLFRICLNHVQIMFRSLFKSCLDNSLDHVQITLQIMFRSLFRSCLDHSLDHVQIMFILYLDHSLVDVQIIFRSYLDHVQIIFRSLIRSCKTPLLTSPHLQLVSRHVSILGVFLLIFSTPRGLSREFVQKTKQKPTQQQCAKIFKSNRGDK